MKKRLTSLQKKPHEMWEDNAPKGYPSYPPSGGGLGPSIHFSDDLVESYNNPNWKERTSKAMPVGGDFHVVRRFYSEYNSLGDPVNFSTTSNPSSIGKHHRTSMTYNQLLWNITNDDFPTSNPSSKATLAAFGRKAIAAVNPTNSSFDGATFLGELREGLPKAIGLSSTGRGRTLSARNAGSEYLNVEFGWRPLISDINDFMYTANNSEKIWQQYKRNCGKLVKRSYSAPDVHTTTITPQNPDTLLRPTLQTGCYTGTGTKTANLTVETTRKMWFEGVFKYWLPESAIGQKLSKWNKLWGIRPDPSTLWELAPWSWAADWVGDTGVLMNNLSAFSTDSLVMPWAFVMEESSTKHTWEVQFTNIYRSYPGQTHIIRQSLETVTKRRIMASPYGFQLTWDTMSPRQIAIAGSVGLTKT